MVEAHDLKVNEMPLTGESDDVSKKARPRRLDPHRLTPEHMVYSGCSVTSGSARGITAACGMRPEKTKTTSCPRGQDGL